MKGILLINLGSPKSPSVDDVRIYLREFLMDKRVIDAPWLIRKFIVETQILPNRPKSSAHAYQSVWTKEGSPLIVISKQLQKALQAKTNIPISLAMRYQHPSIEEGIQELHDKGVTEILAIPLYPQYAMSTTETVVEKVKEVQKKKFKDTTISFLPPFYNDEGYLKALANKIKSNLPDKFDKLIFSYHGIPERHIKKTDPYKTCTLDNCCQKESSPSHKFCYRHQCYYVTKKVSELLGLDDKVVMQTFQSRLGNQPWLSPYTDHTLEKIAKKGVKNIAIVAPAFVSDCLETLEELAVENRDIFLGNGGRSYTYIECLNTDTQWQQWLLDKINLFIEKKEAQ